MLDGTKDGWEDLQAAIAESQRELQQTQEALAAVSVTVESWDQMFRGSFDATAQLTALEVQHDDYRDLEPSELGERIVALVQEGQRAVRQQTQSIVAASIPFAGSPEAFLDPDGDVASLFPEGVVTSLNDTVSRALGGGRDD